MTKQDVSVKCNNAAVNRVEALKYLEIYKIKKKNPSTTNREVLGGPHTLGTKDKVKASIWVYRNIYNIFVGHMLKILTFDTFSNDRPPKNLQKFEVVLYV